jgi:hypothetical protein
MSTGGAAMKAIINTEVAVNKVGIIKTPNHPMSPNAATRTQRLAA